MGGGEEVEEDNDDNGASNEEITIQVLLYFQSLLQEAPIDILIDGKPICSFQHRGQKAEHKVK